MKTSDLIKALLAVKIDLVHADMHDAAGRLGDVIEELDGLCTLHDAAADLLAALDSLLEVTLDQDVAFGIELTEKEQAAREAALAAMEKAYRKTPHNDANG